jgi:hypothetical protein
MFANLLTNEFGYPLKPLGQGRFYPETPAPEIAAMTQRTTAFIYNFNYNY